MLTKRIIPCLDIKDGRTVKGIHFENIKDAGDPIELAAYYAANGADELVFLDITATLENRKTMIDLVRETAKVINIPFTVGGGIKSESDVYALLNAGADKISINTYAVNNPQQIEKLAKQFGSQCIVVAIDTKFVDEDWYVYLNGGRKKHPYRAFDWAKVAENSGAGEILLTSMNNDGTKKGYDIEITKKISLSVNIPVIASGGAGCMADILEVFRNGYADAALAASIFHYKEIEIPVLKEYLKTNNIEIRL
jgi:cyclase